MKNSGLGTTEGHKKEVNQDVGRRALVYTRNLSPSPGEGHNKYDLGIIRESKR